MLLVLLFRQIVGLFCVLRFVNSSPTRVRLQHACVRACLRVPAVCVSLCECDAQTDLPLSGDTGGSHAHGRKGKGGVGVVIAINNCTRQKKAHAVRDTSLPAGGSAPFQSEDALKKNKSKSPGRRKGFSCCCTTVCCPPPP